MTKGPKTGNAERPIGGPVLLGVITLGLVGLLFGAMWYIAQGGAVPSFGKRAKPPVTLEGMGWGVAQVKCEEAVRALLRDPASARFEAEQQPQFAQGRWTALGDVRARNAFNADVVTPWLCTVTGTSQADAVAQVRLLR